MHTLAAKTHVEDGLDRTMLDLLQAVNELLAALVRASWLPPRPAKERDATPQVRDVGWLRPLAIVSVELEHAIRRRSALHAVTVAARCDELTRLLAASPTKGSDFAARYAWERAQSPSLAILHSRVIAGCAHVTSRCSPSCVIDFDEV
jgi:hypothetical protein